MFLLLALAAGASWGASDYVAGRTTRQESGISVVAGAHLTGLLALLVLVPLMGGVLSPAVGWWGAAAGVFGSAGAALLYRGLAVGRMTVVAPVTAAVAAALPTLAGLGLGETLSGPLLVGVVLALAAVVLVATAPEDDAGRQTPAALAAAVWETFLGRPGLVVSGTILPRRAPPPLGSRARWLAQPGLREALLGGVGFGGFYLFLERAPDESGLWPLLAARVASLALLVVLAFVAAKPVLPTRGARPAVVVVGVLDIAASVLYVVATHSGPLAVVAVLASLYPVTTVALARAFDDERCSRTQVVGLATAAAGVALLSLG